MATQIILVPDFYFHQWDDGAGELWLGLRAHMWTEAEVDTWIANPHDATAYDYVLVDEVPRKDMFEIVLPSNADIWVATTDAGGTVTWSEYARRRDTRMKASDFPSDPKPTSGLADTFPWICNERMRAIALDTKSGGPKAARDFLKLSLNTGKRLAATAPCNRPWSTQIGATFRPNPAFDAGSENGVGVTGLHWWTGMMHRLGRKSDGSAAGLRGIDIVVSWGTSNYTGVGEPQWAQYKRWSIPSGTAPIPPHLAARNTYLADLIATIPPRFDLAPIAGVPQYRQPPPAYWDPHITSFQRETMKLDGKLYAHADRKTREDTAGLVRPVVKAGDLLRDLALLELSGVSAPSGTPAATITPGLLIRGMVRPYRRFPAARSTSGGQARLSTVCVLTPDPDCAAGLRPILEASPPAFAAEVNGQSVIDLTNNSRWTCGVILAGILPWDGPEPLLRVLVESAETSKTAGEPLTFDHGRLEFFLPLAATIALTDVVGLDDRTVFYSPAGPFDLLPAYAGLKQRPGANFLQVNTQDISEVTSLAAVYAGDYEFSRGQSVLRTERIIEIDTPTVPASAGVARTTQAEDLAAYNTLRIRRRDASIGRAYWAPNGVIWADGTVHDSSEVCGAAPCSTALGLRQVIPVADSWPGVPSDVAPDAASDWQAVRSLVFDQYRIDQSRPDRTVFVMAQHSYGDLIDPDCALAPCERLPWPVELPTAAEIRQVNNPSSSPTAPTPGRDQAAFIEVAYAAGSGELVLNFNGSVLDFPSPAALPANSTAAQVDAVMAQRARFSRGLTAWRSLAEIVQAQDIALEIMPVAYNLDTSIPERWSGALRATKLAPFALSVATLAALRNWARSCFASNPVDYVLRVPVDTSDWTLAARASVARVSLSVTRAAAQDASDLPADVGKIGRGVDAGNMDPDKSRLLSRARALPVDPKRLQSTYTAWRATLAYAVDSVTPTAATAAGTGGSLPARDALISELEGSDWFAPTGAPDYAGLTVDTLIVPLGFANPAPSTELGALTQPALERLFLALQDYVDLAYPAFAPLPSATITASVAQRAPRPVEMPASPAPPALHWDTIFRRLATLGAGLDALAADLADRMIVPQPDSAAAVIDRKIADWITKLSPGDSSGARAALQTRLTAMMVAQPSTYTDAKALLLTMLELRGGDQTKPDLSTVAGARYRRDIRPEKPPIPNSVGAGPAIPPPPSTVGAELGLRQGIAVAAPPAAQRWTTGLAFLEALPDTQYDNAFALRAATSSVESFEQMIDPQSVAVPWTTPVALSPLAAENAKPDVRQVRLASRAPLLAPVQLRAAAIAAFQNGRLQPGQNVATMQLLSDQLATGTADLRVVGTWPKKPKLGSLRVDQQVFTAIYLVRGDEEGDSGSPDMFDNDGFYPRMSRVGSVSASASKAINAVGTPLGDDTVAALKELSSARRLSSKAFTQIENVSGQLAAIGDRLLFPSNVEEALGFGFAVGLSGAPPYQATLTPLSPPPDDLLQVSLLRKIDGADPALAWLVIDSVAEVWEPLEQLLVHGRNTLASDYAYAAPFRRAETSIVARHQATGALGNAPSHWTAPDRRVALDASWWDKAKSIDALLELVGKQGIWAFDKDKSLEALSRGYRLSVTVFQEQFVTPPAASMARPIGRFPLRNIEVRSKADAGLTSILFPDLYTTYSVDLQWYAATGASALRLERVFVDFSKFAFE